MRSTADLEALILRNLSTRKPAFDGFSDAERADYAETVRIGNEARAALGGDALVPFAALERHDSNHTGVPYVDVWYEDGIKLSRPIRVF